MRYSKKLKPNNHLLRDVEIFNETQYFLYLIGETSTSTEIVEDTKKYFKIEDDKKFKEINIIILYTPLNFNFAQELCIDLSNQFNDVNALLISPTKFEILKHILNYFDTTSTVIKILGGTWINALTIANFTHYSTIIVNQDIFKSVKKKEITEKIPIYCGFCDNQISSCLEITYGEEGNITSFYDQNLYMVCSNSECKKSGSITKSYILDNKPEEGILSSLIDSIKYLQIKEKEKKDVISIPSDWELYCTLCNQKITKRVIKKSTKENESYFLCSNEDCKNYSKKTHAYKPMKSEIICWKCMNKISKYKIKIDEEKKILEMRPYCDECDEMRERNIKLIEFD